MYRLAYIGLTMAALVTAAHANHAPVVSNVRAVQRSGTMLVDITYDVDDRDGDGLTITLEMSADGGGTWDVRVATFEAGSDEGRGILSGTGKHIVWNAGVDVPDVYGTNYVPKVIADDALGGGGDLTVDLPGGAQMAFVWIESGTFTMGSSSSEPGRYSDEGPQHAVTLSRGFYLGKYELTQGQWESVMDATPWSGRSYVQANPNHPAVYISWEDVQVFVHALNEAAGDSLYRLPTEAEFEYACRGGTTTHWSFGDDESQLGDYAWYYDNAWNIGEMYAHAVGTKLPNPWGLYDMHGNVWEWCQDWYGSYSSGSQINPLGPATGSGRAGRGGHFRNFARGVRSAYRYSYTPGSRGIDIGARLLRTQ